MLKKFFLLGTVCSLMFFGFYRVASAASKNYICGAKGLGSTDKINIEFFYNKGDKLFENLYINITKISTGKLQTWDALHSSDGDYDFWTTPVLRDVGIGINPLVIVADPGYPEDPGSKITADFGSKTYPVKCTPRK